MNAIGGEIHGVPSEPWVEWRMMQPPEKKLQ
jgi:hypothetical protein